MSFRQFGGLNYAAKHNAVASNYNSSNNLQVTQNVGQPNSYINFLSDISGNFKLNGNVDISGNFIVSGDLDVSGNADVTGNITLTGELKGTRESWVFVNGAALGRGTSHYASQANAALSSRE